MFRATLPRRGERGLPALSAILFALCYPPLHPLVLPFLALVPLALFVVAREAGSDGAASAARGGALFALVHFGLVLHWLPIALAWFTPLALIPYLLGLALLAVFGGLLGRALHHAVHTLRAPLWLALPVAWTAVEWGLAHLPGTLAFPWLGLGTTLTGFPELVGIAEVIGARGVSFWIALVNGLVACVLLTVEKGRSAGSPGPLHRTLTGQGIAVLITAAVPMGWGVWRATTIDEWTVGRIAILQPNLSQGSRLDSVLVRDSTFATLDRLVPQVPPGSVDLAVLPEMLLPIEPADSQYAADVERLRSYAREMGAPLLFGARGRAVVGEDSPLNSAFLLETGGLADFRYDKHRLVPVVERALYIPLGVPEYLRPRGDFVPGEGWPLAEVDGVGYGVMICFEAAFADVARSLSGAGADVLVNLTNDAWFGRDLSHARTGALWQHPAHLVMRAIETRTAVVRVGNAGLSFWVDPGGRVRDRIGLFEEGVRIAEIRSSDVTTIYVEYGDLLGNASGAGGLLLLLSAWWSWWRVRRDGV